MVLPVSLQEQSPGLEAQGNVYRLELCFQSLNEGSRLQPFPFSLLPDEFCSPQPTTLRQNLSPAQRAACIRRLVWALPWSPRRYSVLLSQIMGLPTLHSGPAVP